MTSQPFTNFCLAHNNYMNILTARTKVVTREADVSLPRIAVKIAIADSVAMSSICQGAFDHGNDIQGENA